MNWTLGYHLPFSGRISNQSQDWGMPVVTEEAGGARLHNEFYPVWGWLIQDYPTEVGGKYKYTVTIKPVLQAATGEIDPSGVEYRVFGIGANFADGTQVANGVWTVLDSGEIIASAETTALGVEFRSRYGLQRNGVLVGADLLALIANPTTPPASDDSWPLDVPPNLGGVDELEMIYRLAQGLYSSGLVMMALVQQLRQRQGR